MKYYAIENSMNTKIVGKIPQTKDILSNCHVDEPRFIDNMIYQKIEEVPILPTALLFPKAKITDFIFSFVGFNFGSMLISDKFKKILERFNLFELQFFPTYFYYYNCKIDGYWQTHISKQGFELLDFEKINFVFKKRIDEKVVYEDIDFINSLESFLKCKDEKILPTELYFLNLILKKDEFDYFFIPHYINGNGYGIVSENLKNELENQGVTGVEFRPIEMSSQDWRHSGEREKTYGKT